MYDNTYYIIWNKDRSKLRIIKHGETEIVEFTVNPFSCRTIQCQNS